MSNLKRKDAPGGHPPAKSAKNFKEARPTTKNESATKDAGSIKAPVVSVLKEEEPIFPRGGGSILTPLEQKQIQLEAKADARREEEFDTGSKVQKKKKRQASLKKGDKKGGKAAEEEDSVKVESLNFKVCIALHWMLVLPANLSRNWSRAPSSSDKSPESTPSASRCPYPTISLATSPL